MLHNAGFLLLVSLGIALLLGGLAVLRSVLSALAHGHVDVHHQPWAPPVQRIERCREPVRYWGQVIVQGSLGAGFCGAAGVLLVMALQGGR